MPVFDQLQPWAFDNIKFPVINYNVSSKLRDHVHQYPHSPGGAVEKLGRELYRFHVRASFQTTFKKFGTNLWPGDMSDLRDRFENQITSDLLVPTIGTIKAYIVSWDQSGSGKVRSGEYADIEFREDQDAAFLINHLINVKVSNLADAGLALKKASLDAGKDVGSVTGLISDVTAIGDQVELYGSLVSSKLDGIVSACDAIDVDLSQPVNFPLVYALHDVSLASITMKQDILKKSVPIVTFLTPTVMSVTDVATSLYGDASRASEVLQLNALEDPFRIARNAALRVYAS